MGGKTLATGQLTISHCVQKKITQQKEKLFSQMDATRF